MKRLLFRCLCLMQLLVCAGFAANVTGRWNGSRDAGGKPTRLVLVVTEESGGALKATVELHDMGGIKLPLDGFTKDAAGAVAFELKVSNAEYAGKLSADGKEIVGEWKQSGSVLPLTFYRPGAEPLRKPLPPQQQRGKLTMTPCGPAFREDQKLCAVGCRANCALPSEQRHVVLKNSTHGSESTCINDLVGAFVDAGSAKGLDTSCAAQGKFPPFLTKAKLKALTDSLTKNQ